MINNILHTFRRWLGLDPVKLAIVRRYQDANGNYVGELYLDRTMRFRNGIVTGFTMVGMSLDSFPLNATKLWPSEQYYAIDTRNDFLAPMPLNRIRVGAIDPKDNDRVRRMVRWLPIWRMEVTIQNRFVEHILERKRA